MTPIQEKHIASLEHSTEYARQGYTQGKTLFVWRRYSNEIEPELALRDTVDAKQEKPVFCVDAPIIKTEVPKSTLHKVWMERKEV